MLLVDISGQSSTITIGPSLSSYLSMDLRRNPIFFDTLSPKQTKERKEDVQTDSFGGKSDVKIR